jgi:hypothetical protein
MVLGGLAWRSSAVFLAVFSGPPQSMPPFVPLLSFKQAGEEAWGVCVYDVPSAAPDEMIDYKSW